MGNEKQILIARLDAFRRSLEKASDKQKLQFVSISTGQQYDSLRNETGKLHPSISNSLPPSLSLDFGESFFCEKYLDLEINVEQLIGLIEVATT